jgi:DNA-binding transcriptional MerR regulator
MFSIGEFARHGRVSVRMLRHYDAIGLIRPACVDPDTGYRFYQASQLDELNRVIALKDLGFTLQQVQAILEEKVTAAELRGMLKLRRAEIQALIGAETTRLARVEARLMTIEDEARAPADGVVVKRLAPVRVAELTGVAAGYEPEAITPVIQPLYHDLWQWLCSAGITAAGPALAYYEEAGDGGIVVHAAVPVATGPAEPSGPGVSIVDLAEAASAAAIIHHGSMDDVLPTGQALARWIDANGYRSAGYAREITLNWSPDPEQWVTELQQPIDKTGG